MSSLIGIHATKNGIKQLPSRAILSLNGVGLGGDEIHQDTIKIVRDTRVFPDGEAPPDFNSFVPGDVTWQQYGEYWYSQRTENGGSFKNAWNLNPADYYQICNEQGGNDAWALQRLVDIERAISQAANADGRQCCILNLAGGTPGDFELWKQIIAPFILEAWENGRNIYGRHCYADKFVNDDGSIVPGQPQRIIDELEYLKSQGYQGGMVLTECGLYGGYGVANYTYFEQQAKRWEAALMAYADIFIGLCWWEGGNTGFNADYTNHLKALVPYMQSVTLSRWQPNEDENMEPKNCDLYLDLGRFVHLLPQNTTDDEIATIARQFNAAKNSFVYSHDDAELIVAHGRGENLDGKKVSEVRIWEPERFTDDVIEYFASRGYKYSIGYFDGTPPTLPPTQINLKYRPCQTQFISQVFGANPGNYPLTPGHEGLDYAVVKDGAFYAAADGIVVHASNLRWSSNTLSDYGWHVVLNHGDYCTVYAHARQDLPVTVGQNVTAGQIVGYSGNTGNSTGYHLHFTLLDKTGTVDPDNGYPVWKFGRPVDPWPFVEGKPAPALPQPTIDLLSWIRGDHRRQFDKEYKLASGVTGTQTTQVFHVNNGNDWLYIKGEQGHYEHLGLRTHQGKEWIFRFEDTSESWDRWYAHFLSQGGAIGAPWLPRFVEIGKWYETPKWVQHYGKDSVGNPLCNQLNNGNVVDKLRVISEPYSKTYQSGQIVQVITVEWSSGEQYDFSGGNIAFRNSAGDDFWFMQWLEGRADKTYKKVGCLPIGW